MTTAKRLADIQARRSGNYQAFISNAPHDIIFLLDLIAERDAEIADFTQMVVDQEGEIVTQRAEIKLLRLAAAEALHHIADAAPGEAYLTLQNIGEP